jgi:hypothetical protein
MGCDCQNENNSKPFTEYSIVKASKSIIKHFTDPSYNAFVSDEVKAERLKKCEDCDLRDEFFGKKRCSVCLCFLEAKSSLVDQDCPHPQGSKWQKNQ